MVVEFTKNKKKDGTYHRITSFFVLICNKGRVHIEFINTNIYFYSHWYLVVIKLSQVL